MDGLVRASAVNVLQSLAATEIKTLVDNMKGDSLTKETTRAALQAVLACGGAAAGSGDCGSAFAGAAAGVVLTNLLFEKERPTDKDGDGIIDGRDLSDQQAITNLVTTLVGAIANGSGLDVSSAVTAAQIEIENNGICDSSKFDCQTNVAEILARGGQTLAELKASDKPEDQERYDDYIEQFGSEDRANAFLSGRNELAILADRLVKGELSQEEQNAYLDLLKMADGDLFTAQNIAGLRSFYEEDPTRLLELGLASPHVQDIGNIITRLEVAKDFVDGTSDGVVDDAKAAYEGAKDILSDPIEAAKELAKAVQYIVNNPGEVIEQLGEAGEQYVEDVYDASILLEASIIANEPGLQEQAAETLGRLVGTPIAEALISFGVAPVVIKVGGKTLSLVSKSINRKDAPNADSIPEGKPATNGFPPPSQGLTVPQGFTIRQFDNLSSTVRADIDARGLGDDIFIQGSRAAGTARPDSDVDIAIRVSPERFNEIIDDPSQTTLSNPNAGTSLERTRIVSIRDGRIQTTESRLDSLKKTLQRRFGKQVQISIIRKDGPFDNGPQTPLSFDFKQ